MSLDWSSLSAEERDARLTSLLLGELAPGEAEELRAIIATDSELARACVRRGRTITLLREAASLQRPGSAASETVPAEPARLSDDRREKLLQAFRSSPPVQRTRRTVRLPSWSMPMSLAAVFIGLLIVVAALVSFPARKSEHITALPSAWFAKSDTGRSVEFFDSPSEQQVTLTIRPPADDRIQIGGQYRPVAKDDYLADAQSRSVRLPTDGEKGVKRNVNRGVEFDAVQIQPRLAIALPTVENEEREGFRSLDRQKKASGLGVDFDVDGAASKMTVQAEEAIAKDFGLRTGGAVIAGGSQPLAGADPVVANEITYTAQPAVSGKPVASLTDPVRNGEVALESLGAIVVTNFIGRANGVAPATSAFTYSFSAGNAPLESRVKQNAVIGERDALQARLEDNVSVVTVGRVPAQGANFSLGFVQNAVTANPAGLPATAPVPAPATPTAVADASSLNTAHYINVNDPAAAPSAAPTPAAPLRPNSGQSAQVSAGDVTLSGLRGAAPLAGNEWFGNSQAQNPALSQSTTGVRVLGEVQDGDRVSNSDWSRVEDRFVSVDSPSFDFKSGLADGKAIPAEASTAARPAMRSSDGTVTYQNGVQHQAGFTANYITPAMDGLYQGTNAVAATRFDDLALGAQDREWGVSDFNSSGWQLNGRANRADAATGSGGRGRGIGGGDANLNGRGSIYAGISILPNTDISDRRRQTAQWKFGQQVAASSGVAPATAEGQREKELKELSKTLGDHPRLVSDLGGSVAVDAAGLPITATGGASEVGPRPSRPNENELRGTVPESSEQITELSARLDNLQALRNRIAANLEVAKADARQPKSRNVQVIEPADAGASEKRSLWREISGAFSGEVQRSAVVSVEPDVPDVDPQGRLFFRPAADPFFIHTETDRVRSTNVLKKVADKLNLNEQWAKGSGKERLSDEETISLLKRKVEVSQQKDTTLLEIRAKSENPNEAATIANSVAEAYAEDRRAAGAKVARGGVEAMEKQLAQQEAEIARAKERLELKRKDLLGEPANTNAPKPSAAAPIPQPEVLARENAFSTFSLNVSDVSFKLAAASLEKGVMPEAAGIRSEEFINAFDYRDPMPASGTPLAFAWERARYPFAHNRDVVRFSIKTASQGREAGKPLNIVLLLDNSGSMERADRVRIIQESLRTLATQLKPTDKLSVVTFARTASLRVDGVSGTNAVDVASKVGALTPEGGTNLEDALDLAYRTALRHYEASAVNRIVLLTDGAANLGNVDPQALKAKVENHRKQGIALDCFGVGWEGLNDDLLEQLSRNGDGRYGFVNTPGEAATEFVGQLAGALRVAASDVKMQVEFNPKRVTAWRQVGYAKHQLTKEQFRDNKVDAAEIGAAESGNALYVIETNPNGDGPIATVRARFRVPQTGDYREHEWSVPFGSAVELQQSSPALRLAASAAAFSEWLASNPFAGEVTTDRLQQILSGVPEACGADPRPKKLEWMIRQARSISGK